MYLLTKRSIFLSRKVFEVITKLCVTYVCMFVKKYNDSTSYILPMTRHKHCLCVDSCTLLYFNRHAVMIYDRQVNDYIGHLNSRNLSSACRNSRLPTSIPDKRNIHKSFAIVLIIFVDLLCHLEFDILMRVFFIMLILNYSIIKPCSLLMSFLK